MAMKYRIWLILAALLVLMGCKEENELTPFVTIEEISIGQFLEDNMEDYSIFYEIAKKSGILEPLKLYNPTQSGDGLYTLFLPENSAFDTYMGQAGYSSVEELLNDSVVISVIARYHTVSSSFKSTDFPFGSLSDSTFTGEYLYIGFDDDFNYKVNNEVDIVQIDIELSNGYIHTINGVLEPIIENSFEYLQQREEYSLITELFELTGLNDTMNIFRTTETGQTIRNYFTLLVESNDVFSRFGITNIDSLISRYATPGLEYTNPDNGIYQFAAYHILEGKYAINDFAEAEPYVTYAYNPMTIDATQDIKINEGVPVFDTIVISGDSVPLNYIRVNLYESNGFSLNGPVHTLEDLLVEQTPTGTYEFQFYNEPVILENKGNSAVSPLELSDPSQLVYFDWTGVESIYYFVGIDGPKDKDCLFTFGNFTMEYETPNISSGEYEIIIRVNKGSHAPQIKLFIDEIQQKSIVDLTLGRTGFRAVSFGTRLFEEFGSHRIRIETVVGGEFYWDWIQFKPVN